MYPWLASTWQQLSQQIEQNRVPHALLITGLPGIGKRALANQLTERLLCETPNGDIACGTCRSCQLLQTGSHPDFRAIEPEEEGKAIKVDTMRSMLHFITLSSQYHHYKIVIIEPADAMNKSASNSLLKTLEEPAGDVVIMLITSRPASLPATIRSRCQKLTLESPSQELAEQWLHEQRPDMEEIPLYLRLAQGSPSRAIELFDENIAVIRREILADIEALLNKQNDAISVASSWQKMSEKTPVYWLRLALLDMLRLRQAPASTGIINIDLKERLQAIVNQLDLTAVYNFVDFLNESMAASTRISINPQLMLEDLLIRWSNIKRCK